MGFGGISIWQLLIVLVIVLLLFGSKKLRSVGSDLGGALKGFRGAMKEGEDETLAKKPEPNKIEEKSTTVGRVIDTEVSEKEEKKV